MRMKMKIKIKMYDDDSNSNNNKIDIYNNIIHIFTIDQLNKMK